MLPKTTPLKVFWNCASRFQPSSKSACDSICTRNIGACHSNQAYPLFAGKFNISPIIDLTSPNYSAISSLDPRLRGGHIRRVGPRYKALGKLDREKRAKSPTLAETLETGRRYAKLEMHTHWHRFEDASG